MRIASGSLLETSDRELREDLLQKLVDQRLMGPSAQICLNPDPSKLPIRELPHGSYANLFVMYLAFCRMSNEQPAGKSLFYQAAMEWKSCLKFHKKSVHQVCSVCAELKAKIQHASDACTSLSFQLQCSLYFFFLTFGVQHVVTHEPLWGS